MLKGKCLKSVSLLLVSMLFVTMLMGVSFPGKVSAATVGSVDLSGDPTFDSDSVSDNSSVDQTRWLSYPGSRFSLNANSINVYENVGPMATDLPLDMGGWVGTTWVNFQKTVKVQVAPVGGSYSNASSVSTTWYPYKITFDASYANPSGTTLTGYDFNVDANGTVIRVINVNGTAAKQVQLTGTVNGTGAVWDSTNRVVLITGSNYYYAIRIVGLDGSMNPFELTESASVNGSTWTFTKQYSSTGKLGVSFGFATSGEGSSVAINRAKNCLSGNASTTLSTVKSYFDTKLRLAPKPANYGIEGASQQGATADRHRRVYYEAWTFTISNLMNDLPEDSFGYKQVLCGKPSKWGSGDPSCPGVATWNSLMGIMSLVYIMPDEAWNAYQGMISLIDLVTGQIPGESLPTRFAQVAWLLYQKTGDLTKLTGIYSNLKKHLLYAEQNPRWIHIPSGHDNPYEKDLEFCNSFIWDAGFAAKIAQAVGETADVSLWQQKQQTMLNNMRTWFFSTPGVVFQYYYVDTGVRYVNEGHESMRNVAISIENLPVDMLIGIKDLFFSRCEPNDAIGGLPSLKAVTGDLITYGLLDKGEKQAAYNLVHSCLRDAILASNLADVYANFGIGDVRPSAFGSTLVILFTWFANNMRIDSGTETAIDFGTISPKTITMLEDFSAVGDWSTSNASITTTNGVAQITSNSTYGYAAKSVNYNVDSLPYVTINIPEVGAGCFWSIKVNDGGADINIALNATGCGEYSFDLKTLTGWSGNKTFNVKLFAAGGTGKYFKVDYLNAERSMSPKVDNFSTIQDWTLSNATIAASTTAYSSKVAQVTCGNASYGYVSKSITENVDAFPYISINVPEIGAGCFWSLKVNDGSGDIDLVLNSTQAGVLTADLKALTGWSGNKTFNVKLYAAGGNGKYFKVDNINVCTSRAVLDEFNSVTDWATASNATISTSSGTATVTCTGQSYGYVAKSATYNVTAYPKIIINVPEVGAGCYWSLHVNDGGNDISIVTNSTSTGEFTYDLKTITGWSGNKTFNVKLYAAGGNGKYFKVNYIAVK